MVCGIFYYGLTGTGSAKTNSITAIGMAIAFFVLAGLCEIGGGSSLIGQNWNTSEIPENLSKLPTSDLGAITGTATGLKKGLVLGNLIGGTSGLLLGIGLLALPGVGQVVLSSVIVFTLLSGRIGTAAGGLMGALIGLGLTSEQAKKYSQLVANGNILLLVEGTVQESVTDVNPLMFWKATFTILAIT